MTNGEVQAWLDRYVEAWLSYDPAAIGDLFSDDAEYRYHPWNEGDGVVRGRTAIVSAWTAPDNRDAPGTYSAEYRPFAVEGDRAVAVGWSRYVVEPGGDVRDVYDNCFVLEFDGDRRCRSFTEWFVKRPASSLR